MSVIKCGKLSPFNLVVQRFLAGIRRVCVSSVYCKWMSECELGLWSFGFRLYFGRISKLAHVSDKIYVSDRQS